MQSTSTPSLSNTAGLSLSQQQQQLFQVPITDQQGPVLSPLDQFILQQHNPSYNPPQNPSSSKTLPSEPLPQPILHSEPLHDHKAVRDVISSMVSSPDFQRINYPTPLIPIDKKLRYLDRFTRTGHVVENFRIANHDALALGEQLKQDVAQFRDNLAYNEKQQIILRRERDMLEHRFKLTRADFNLALSASTLLRQKITEITESFQQEIAFQSLDTTQSLTRLDDVQFFYNVITQIQTKYDDLNRFCVFLKNDVVVLQSLLQNLLSIAFDSQGTPITGLADALQTLPVQEFERLQQLSKARLGLTIDTPQIGIKTDKITEQSRDNNNNNIQINTTSKPAPPIQTTNFEHNATSYVPGVEPLSILPIGLDLPPGGNDSIDNVIGQMNVIDTFLTKCVTFSGHFQPQVFLDHLRRQSDQLLLLQRSHTLLTSQLFQAQQDKALLLVYFESFLKEIASMKQILYSSNIKVDEDTRSIYALQQKNLVLQQEIQFMQSDRILTQTMSQIEAMNQNTVVENSLSVIEQLDRSAASLAVAHQSIYKLRTVNAQQSEQIAALQEQLAKAEKEKHDLAKIIVHLEAKIGNNDLDNACNDGDDGDEDDDDDDDDDEL
jgi:hypothetical protein